MFSSLKEQSDSFQETVSFCHVSWISVFRVTDGESNLISYIEKVMIQRCRNSAEEKKTKVKDVFDGKKINVID